MFKRFFAWLDRDTQKAGHNNAVSQVKERPEEPAPMKPEGPPNRVVREGLSGFSWLGPKRLSENMMLNRLIKSEADYDLVLARIGELMDAEVDTFAGEELIRLVSAVKAYEDEHYPMEKE